MSRDDLAARQAALVAALVAGGPIPAGFAAAAVRAAADALLRKRAGEAGQAWPTLRASFGPRWMEVCCAFAAGRPPRGAVSDGWDLARFVAARGELAPAAAAELAAREALWHYDGESVPRRRRLPALRRLPGGLAVQVFGRVYVWRRRGG